MLKLVMLGGLMLLILIVAVASRLPLPAALVCRGIGHGLCVVRALRKLPTDG